MPTQAWDMAPRARNMAPSARDLVHYLQPGLPACSGPRPFPAYHPSSLATRWLNPQAPTLGLPRGEADGIDPPREYP